MANKDNKDEDSPEELLVKIFISKREYVQLCGLLRDIIVGDLG
jgi:hypothetical protein